MMIALLVGLALAQAPGGDVTAHSATRAPTGGAVEAARPDAGRPAEARRSPGAAWVEGARALLGTPYRLGGRKAGEAIDCLGVVFAAAEHAGRCGWRSFSVNPTELVSKRLLGAPVAGASPVASGELDVAALQPGDVVMLLAPDQNPAEPALASLDGGSVWVWHVGLYSGDGRWIVGDHFAGQTVEVDLAAYLAEHADTYSGVYVVRPPGSRPAVCRQHRPLVPR